MDDLISRAAALNAIDCWHIDFNSMDGAKVQTDCWRTIKELPAVDAAPVRHGRWGKDCDCSVCHFMPWYEHDIHTLSYCPNCGAKMEKES